MKSELRPAFYALPLGSWRDYVTLFHLPYTGWHLSYVVIGAASAPSVHLDRVAGLLLAFFLAVGISAHALDEFRGRPLGTRISDGRLLALAALSLAGSLTIGAAASVLISPWAVPFVLFGGFIVVAYNLELFGGRFHSDAWFGLAWGAYPALVGYWANAERVDPQALLVAAGCFALSLAQRRLSNRARGLRRNALTVSGQVRFRGGAVEEITVPYLLSPSEGALRLLGAAVTLLAAGLLLARI